MSQALKNAVSKIDERHMLLVFPLDNRKEPASLWSELHPRTKMRWEWDENGDDRVSKLWHLREQLSKSGQVIYAKWFRGRATLISFSLFPSLLRVLGQPSRTPSLSFQAREILDLLEEDSPLSTKQLKRAVGLQGKENERVYERAMKELWSKLLIVGYGEVDEGAFPSLAVGSTKVLFEDLWNEAVSLSPEKAMKTIESSLPADGPFKKFFARTLKDVNASRDLGEESSDGAF